MQASENQQQSELQQQVTLLDQIGTQLHDPALSFTVPPTFSQQIGRDGDFSAQVFIGNSSTFLKSGYLLIAFTPPGATRPQDTLETYHRFVAAPGGSTLDIRIPNADLISRGIEPGRWLITFAAYNAFDERIGGPAHGFFGNPFTFGLIEPTFTAPPAYPAAIADGTDFESLWLVGNNGDTTDSLTLLTVITPLGTTNSREFYKGGFLVPPGGAAHTVRLTAAELAAAGIGPGRYLITFAAFDGFGNRIGGATFGFFGNPFTIGIPEASFTTAPSYTQSIPIGGRFQADFLLSNTGDAPERISLVTVITPAGSTNPADSREFYRAVDLPVGGGTFDFDLAPAELAAAGIGPGRYNVTFLALDAFDRRIGGPNNGFFGNPLTIGTIQVALPTAPAIPVSIGEDEDLSVDFQFTNTGNAPDRVYALLAFTPPGSKDPSATIEVYCANVVVPPGAAASTFLLTAAERVAAGIGPGDWLVTATAFNGADQRMESYFGNPLTIGTASPALGQAPTYTPQIGVGSPLETDWVLGNTGTAPATVTLVVAVTPVAETGTAATVEFKQTVLVPPGGGSFAFDIAASELAAEGIGAGQYLLSFVALRPNGNRIGEFFGNFLTIGTVAPVFNQLPLYSDQIPVGGDLESTWLLDNTGDAPANVTLVMALTPAGQVAGSATTEFSRNVVVPPGGGAFDFTVTGAQLAAAGLGAGDYTLSFVAIGVAGNHIGEFFGNLLRIGEALPSIGQAPIYSNRLAVGEEFTSQWTIGNAGSVTADVQLLTVLTRVGTGVSREFYQDAAVPPGGGVVNDVITAAELAAQQIDPGDYTVAFILFDGGGNRIGEFFGNPLAIGEASLSLGQAPGYTAAVPLAGTFESDWALGNSGAATGRVTLVVAMTRVGSGPTVEFRQVVDVPPGGALFSFDVSAAERTAQGVGGGAHTVSFVAFDPLGNRIGEFFGRPLMFGAATPVFDTVPAFPGTVPLGSPFETDWTLGNSGDAPADVTLVIALTRVGSNTSAELDRAVVVDPGGGAFAFNLSAAELAAAGITPGEYLASFAAVDVSGNRLGLFAGNVVTFGTVEPSFSSLPVYPTQIAEGAPLATRWQLGNTGNAPANVTLVISVTPVGGVGSAATQEFSLGVVVPAGGGTFDFELSAAQLAAAGVGPGQYTLGFVTLGLRGNRIGEFLGNLLQIGEGSAGMDLRPAYTDRLQPGDPFGSIWQVNNPGPATAHVTLLTVLTRVGTGDFAEFYLAAAVPVGGDAVDMLITSDELAGEGIGEGDYTVAFILFDANDQRIAEFFGSPLRIGDAAPSFTQLPDYSDAIPLNGTFHSSWAIGNLRGVNGVVTLVAALTRLGGQSVEFSQEITVPPGGGVFDFDLTAAQREAGGLGGGFHTVSFVALSGGQRIGEFFGNELMIGSALPALPTTPSHPAMIAEGAPFETDWTLTNSGDAPADVTLTIAITPAGGVTSTATVEFEQAVVVGPGGGTFAFDLSAAQLAGQGIGGGEYTVSFVATDVFGNRVGAFFGNPLAIGQAEPGVSGAPAYDSTLNVGQAFSADWGLTNTGALNGLVTLLTVITPSGGVGREFYQAATIPPGGALIEQRIPASQLDARGIGAGQYTVAFILFDANDQRIAEFFGNPLTIGSAQPTLPAAPSYTNSITEGQNFVSNWAIGNTGDATAAVTLLTVITPTGTDNSREFYQPGSVPPGGATLEMVVTAQRLAGAGIGAGTYTVAFILFDAADNRVAQFFGNLLTISPGVTQQSSSSGPAASSSPTTIAVVAPGSDFVAPVPTQSFSQPSSGPVTLTALFTPQAGAQATGPLQVSRTFVLPPTGGLLDFRLTAGELSLLNLLPGLYRLDLLAFDGFGSLIDDNFFQALVEFLFG